MSRVPRNARDSMLDASPTSATTSVRRARPVPGRVGAGQWPAARRHHHRVGSPAAAAAGAIGHPDARDLQNLVGDGRRRRILLKGGVVLSLDPQVGDFEKADVLIDGKTIAQIAPNIAGRQRREWSTARARSSCLASSPLTITSSRRCSAASSRTASHPEPAAADGWPQEAMARAGNIWTAGRIPEPGRAAIPARSSGTWGARRTTPRTCTSRSSWPV